MTDSRPERVEKLRGLVTKAPYAKGSKSERHAVFLETESARYVLRRKKGPVFADKKLKRFVGHTVECDGFLLESTLLAEKIEVVKE
jgi:hypothetical protein